LWNEKHFLTWWGNIKNCPSLKSKLQIKLLYKQINSDSNQSLNYQYFIPLACKIKLSPINDVTKRNIFTGVCHADELMYLFNMDLPFILCDVGEIFGKRTHHFEKNYLVTKYSQTCVQRPPMGPEWSGPSSEVIGIQRVNVGVKIIFFC